MRYKFNDFVEKYNKKYETTEEFMDRLKVFTENVKDIEAHNNRRDVSWTKGINQFSDLTAQEFKAIHASGLLNIVKRQSEESKTYDSSLKPISELPESKDWRDEGIISVDASVWHSYEGGIFDGCSYEENIEINHGVQLVGYGTDAEHGDYWIVRNSWGPEWGEEGFIRLKRETEVNCGTDSTPMMGTACEGDGNAVQKICGMCGVLFDTTYPISSRNKRN